MEQLSPSHKRSLSDNLLYASSENMEIEPFSPNQKRVLTRSDTLPPRMEMGDSSNRGYGQFSKEVVDTSQIKSHSQEISSQTGLGAPGYPSYETPQMDRYLSDDLENNKDLLERSYPKDGFQETEFPTFDYPIGENISDIHGPTTDLPPDLDLPEWENSSAFWRRPPSFVYQPRPVSPPRRRRFQSAPSNGSVHYENNSLVASQDGIGFYNNSKPPSYGDHIMDDFENDNNSNPADLASPKSDCPKPWHIKNPNEETLSKKDNRAISAQLDDVNYTRASNVTLSNFVSVKLSGKSNYDMWNAQMKCLMRSHNMLGLVDGNKELPVDKNNELLKRYEILLAGWLIGSLSEEIIKDKRIYNKGAKGIWDTLEQSYDPYTILPTATLLEPHDKKEKLGMDIDPKLTKKLHNATLAGCWWKTKSILNDHKDNGAATWKLNANRDTLLHVAVRLGNNYFLENLLDVIHPGKEIETVNSEGHTALHIAAIVGNQEAAELLVKKRKELVSIKDKYSRIPLTCASLMNQVNVFVYLWGVTEESHREGSLSENINETFGLRLLHTAIYNKQYDFAMKLVEIITPLAMQSSTLVVLTRNFPSPISFTETLMYPSLNDVGHKFVKRSFLLLQSLEYLYARATGETLWMMRRFKNKYHCSLFPELIVISLLVSCAVPAAVLYLIYRLLCLLILLLLFPFSLLYFILWKVLAFLVVPIKNIEKKRKEHNEAKKFLKWIFSINSWKAKISEKSAFDEFYKESLLEAACLDVYEVLDQILKLSSNAMKVINKDGHNIIQLAVINRSAKVYKLITSITEGEQSYKRVRDVFSNNLFHLAGRLAPLAVLSCTRGAALQLQRELQWLEEVKKLIEPLEHARLNVDYETPEMVFSREHTNLVMEGEKWMKTTAESCSITAALIITIVFAAAITVPGGSNQDTGIPLFKRRIAFNIFAVADAISLFSASTSLLVFLSILTTRFAANDFLISLPRRLFIGLCLLFLSTTTMMFAFSSILFLVFCDERPWMLAPIGGLTCIPIVAIVTLQLPLMLDLYEATSFNIFDKEPNEEDEEDENREEEEEDEEEDKEKLNEEADNEEQAKEEEETKKFQIIERDNNSILKRLSTACCLPLHRENKPIPKRSSKKFCLPLHRGNL